MQSPLLTTPTQYEYDNPVVELNDRVIKNWINQLPLFNLVESIDTLFNAIKPLNEQNVADKHRLKLLEIYRKPVLNIAHSFDMNALRQLPINQEQRQNIVDDVTYLTMEMAAGYKILVKNAFVRGRNPAKDNALLLVVYRAMEMLCESIVHCYQVYKQAPAFAYLEFHQLYQYAERNRCEQRVCRESGQSIANLYVQLLIFSIADPFQLDEGDTRLVFEFLKNFTQICLLGKQPPVAEEDIGIFTVDLSGDSPPAPLSRNKIYRRNPDFRVLDLRPVLATLLKHVKQSDNSKKAISLQEKILGRLVPNLTAVHQRKEPRYKKHRKVNVAMGLQAMHFYLSGKAVKENSHDDMIGIEVVNLQSDQQNMPVFEPWIIANESRRGYLLFQPGNNETDIRIGDFVGIENPSNSASMQNMLITSIRWMRLHHSDQNQIGVEILSHEARAGMLLDDQTAADTAFTCIYFQQADTNHILLGPTGQSIDVRPNRLLLEQDDDVQRHILLGPCLAKSPKYEHYTFTDC